jgi:hypothetical protein
MKKILFTAICMGTIIAGTDIVPGGYNYPSLHALDITVGATTWYAQSEQYYAQKSQGSGLVGNSLIKSNPAFLYGPTLAIRFSSDFNLTFVYLYGTFETAKDTGIWRSKSKYERSDSDLALNYRLGDFFKVFAGIKYLSYDITPADTDYAVFKIKSIDPHTSFGAGVGASVTYPLLDNLFALGTLSVLYLLGSDKVNITDRDGFYPRSIENSYNEYGINTTASLAYYIAPISTVISLGGRFQFLRTNYKKNAICLDSMDFMIYGVTLTATYTFSI